MSKLANLRLATEEGDENDLYSGFNEQNPLYDVDNLEDDEGFIQALKTSHGRRPLMTSMKNSTFGSKTGGFRANLSSSMGRAPFENEVGARPMTSVTGAGYTAASKKNGSGASFDPFNQAGKGISAASDLENIEEDTPEDKIKAMERAISKLIDESAIANCEGNFLKATEKAREAGKKERQLVRTREQLGLSDGISVDLTYSVLFNLAVQFEANEMYPEALNSYQVIVKNKMFQNAGRIKVNMGNIYYKQRQFSKATKYYRMALDQVPNSHKEIRIRIMQNISNAFLKMGQYNDAITSYEHIMNEKPDFKSGLNLILCYFTIGDKEKMSKTFQKLLNVNLDIDDEDKYQADISSDKPQESLYLDAIRNDMLRQMERKRQQIAEYCVLTAAKVIAPAIENSFAKGFDWCIEQVKMSQRHELANDLEIQKALMYLKERDFDQAISILKTFEKKDTQVKAQAATNLAFIYLLQGNLKDAKRYADASVKADKFNSASLTNKGNCLVYDGKTDEAIMLYKEALDNDSSCYEALYNLGVIQKKQGNLDEALNCFMKLHSIVRKSAEVMFQIAILYEMLEDYSQSLEWLMQCVSIAPTDASVLSKLADICEQEDNGDRSQAFAYRLDSYKLFPADISTVEWLGAYFVDSQYSEKAIEYFERAAVIQPNEVKWRLMVASCFRRSGNYQTAFNKYKQINQQFPENIECLKYLNRLCADMGLTNELQEYASKLRKAEKLQESRAQRVNSASKRKNNGSANTSAGSRRSTSGSNSGSSKFRSNLSQDLVPSAKSKADPSYSDPLGPAVERPKTAVRVKKNQDYDAFDDVTVDETMLPD